MGKEVTLRCDICKKPTEQIVGKLFFGPVIRGTSRAVHSSYTHHADVGACCKDRLLKGFNFRKRLTAVEYREQRKAGRA